MRALAIAFGALLVMVVGAVLGLRWYAEHVVVRKREARATEVLKEAAEGKLPLQKVSSSTKKWVTPIGFKKLIVDNPFGSVEVVGGKGPISLEHTLFLPGKTLGDALTLEPPVEVREETTPAGEHKIAVVPTKDTPLLDLVVANLKVTVPPGTAVSVEVTTGEGKVSGITGGVVVHGQGGKVTISDCVGSVWADTTVADLEIASVRGRLEANTSSGDLFIEGVEGPVIARTMSGMIVAKVAKSEQVTANTMNGDLEVEVMSPFSGEMEVRTSSGDITVALPSASNCRVETMTNTGPITCTLPLSEVKRAGPNVSGRLGAGKGHVLVTNDSGAITVKPL